MAESTAVAAKQRELLDLAIERARPSVEDRVVVVSGGARGIGRAMVEGLCKAGARVVVADKSWTGLDELRTQLESSGRGMAVELDVTDDEQVDAAYAAVIKRFGTADVLVNNAALVGPTLFYPLSRKKTLDTTDADWERIFKVNVFGVVKMIRRFIQPMREKGSGSIINVVSSGVIPVAAGGGYFGLRPFTVEMPYQSTKASVMALTFYLGDEVRSQGVAVNAIMPGHTRASWFDENARGQMERGESVGQRPAVCEHVVPVMLFLAGQDARGVTGMLYDVPTWNHDHGYGRHEVWRDYSLPPDLEAEFAKAGTPQARPGMGINTPAMRPS